MQLGLTWVTDTLESSSIMIYSELHMGLYAQEMGIDAYWLNGD